MKKIHHLSLVTTDIDLALNVLNLNRSDIKETILDAQQKNKLFLVYNESNDLWIEFVLPMDKTSTTYNFAKKFKPKIKKVSAKKLLGKKFPKNPSMNLKKLNKILSND